VIILSDILLQRILFFTTGNVNVTFLSNSFQDEDYKKNRKQEYNFAVKTSSIILAAPSIGTIYDIHDLNKANFIDLLYVPSPGSRIDERSINDEDHLVTIYLPDGRTYELNGPPEKNDNAFRYTLPENFKYQTGDIVFEFHEGTFNDVDGNTNEATTQTITVVGPTALMIDPFKNTAIDAEKLNNRGTIDIRFSPSSLGSLNTDTITDNASEFTITNQYGVVYDITGTPVLVDGTTYRYTLPDSLVFLPGEYTIDFRLGTFTDSFDLKNLEDRQSFTVLGTTSGIIGSDSAGRISKDMLINRQGYIDTDRSTSIYI
jgi:hypothetical protein